MPEPLVIESVAGRTMGMLAFLAYEPPSPLVYRELIWMPARVRDPRTGARGSWVAVMVVDDEVSLRAGRELWALPKTLGRFERSERSVRVEMEGGARVAIEWSGRGPAPRIRSRMATLQVSGDQVVRFRADFAANVRIGSARVTVFDAGRDTTAWRGFPGSATRARPASILGAFESTMQPPRR